MKVCGQWKPEKLTNVIEDALIDPKLLAISFTDSDGQ